MSRATGLSFSEALELLKRGGRLSRAGWNGRNMWISLWRPNDHETLTRVPAGDILMSRPFLYMCTVDGGFVPWVASQTDLLESDWETKQ